MVIQATTVAPSRGMFGKVTEKHASANYVARCQQSIALALTDTIDPRAMQMGKTMQENDRQLISIRTGKWATNYDNGFKCLCGHKQRIGSKLEGGMEYWCHECFRSYRITCQEDKPLILRWSGFYKCTFGNHQVKDKPIRPNEDVSCCPMHVESYVKRLQHQANIYREKVVRIEDRIAEALPHIL